MGKDEEISKEIVSNQVRGLGNWALVHLEDLHFLPIGLKQEKDCLDFTVTSSQKWHNQEGKNNVTSPRW